MFGCYYHETWDKPIIMLDKDEDVWALLARAVPEAYLQGRLDALRVGAFSMLGPSVKVSNNWLISRFNEHLLDLRTVLDYLGQPELWTTALEFSFRKLLEDFILTDDGLLTIGDTNHFLEWLDDNLPTQPDFWSESNPLPIERRNGAWLYDFKVEIVDGVEREAPPAEAYIDYVNAQWQWACKDQQGTASTLQEAKQWVDVLV